MKLFKLYRFAFLLLFFFLASVKSYSRCYCTTTITSNSISSYTISSGNCVCLASGLTYTGTITIDGGTLNNYGILSNNNLIMQKGTLNNYGFIKFTNLLSLTPDANLEINCCPGGTLLANAGIYVAATYSADTVFFRTQGNDALMNIYTLTGVSGCMYISQKQDVSAASGSNLFNLSYYLYVDSDGRLYIDNGLNSVFNTGNMYVYSPQKNYIHNEGTMYVTASMLAYLNDGLKIENYNYMNLNSGYFESNAQLLNKGPASYIYSIHNTQINIMGAVDSIRFLNEGTYVGSDFSNYYGHFTNKGYFYSDFYGYNNTSSSNYGTMYPGTTFLIDSAEFNNYNYFGAYTWYLQNDGVFNNYGNFNANWPIIDSSCVFNSYGADTGVVNTYILTNSGRMNLGAKTVLNTTYLYNERSGEIYGASSISSDSTNYASVFISLDSENDGALQDYLYLYDLTYTNTTGTPYLLDVVTNTFDIEIPPVVFGPRCLGIKNFINLDKFAYCNPDDVHASFTSNYPPTGTFSWIFFGVAAGQASSGSPNITFTISGLSSAGTLSVSGNVQSGAFTCPVSKTIAVIFSSVTANAGGPILYFNLGDNYTLNGTANLGVYPYTYTWIPNAFFVPAGANTVPNPVVNPKGPMTYTLLVEDASGCASSSTVLIIPNPYAPLKKVPEGEYYVLNNNKMLFKFDGQYATTQLSYKVYNADHVAELMPPVPVNTSVVNSGDNRYLLDASLLNSGYYTLEVTNEKKEKMYLRFKK